MKKMVSLIVLILEVTAASAQSADNTVTIMNNCGSTRVFSLSYDDATWTTYSLNSGYSQQFSIGTNSQCYFYLDNSENNAPPLHYQLKSNSRYQIIWNYSYQAFDLSEY